VSSASWLQPEAYETTVADGLMVFCGKSHYLFNTPVVGATTERDYPRIIYSQDLSNGCKDLPSQPGPMAMTCAFGKFQNFVTVMNLCESWVTLWTTALLSDVILTTNLLQMAVSI
jgi:hypothetical protein